MSWVSSSSYTQNKDRFFHVAAQLLFVLVKSYLESKKITWTGPFACQRQLLSHILQASYFFLTARWQPLKSEEEHSEQISLSAPHQPARKGKQLFRVITLHLWEHTIQCSENPWELLPFKYFPRKIQRPTKANARLRQEREAKTTLCCTQPRQWEKAVCLFLFSLYNSNCHVNSLIKRSELVTKVLVRNARHCRNQHFNLSFEENEALT